VPDLPAANAIEQRFHALGRPLSMRWRTLVVLLATCAVFNMPEGAIAARGRRVVLFGPCGETNYGIVTIDPSGEELHCLLSEANFDHNLSAPRWSPSRNKVLFSAVTGREADVYVMRSDGSHIRRLAGGPNYDVYADWSPDGRQILFWRENYELWIMDADGSHKQRVIGRVWQPTWSPDGKRIAFSWHSKDLERYYLETVRVDGTGRKKLVRSNRIISDPGWSPDGEALAFVRGQQGSMFVVDRNGTHEREILDRKGVTWPAWSPSGRRIIFSKDELRSSQFPQLFMVSRNGSHMRAITDDEDTSGYYMPDWS
jgi:Tol biopolymer transport system component